MHPVEEAIRRRDSLTSSAMGSDAAPVSARRKNRSMTFSERSSVSRPVTSVSSHTARYYPDLDGLRALAVVPVVLFHAGATWLPGGFVGVDVFFVLSGFFITRQLIADIDSRRFSILKFYERRARRILPALFALLLITTLVATALLVPPDLVSFAKSLLATLGFWSNVHFWLETGYFAQAAHLKPLLHTWSLAVEEQFYIFFPPLLWLLHRYCKSWVLGLLAISAAISFGLGVWGSTHATSATFYLLPTRAWELLAGAMIAHAHGLRLGQSARHLLSIVGLAMVMASLFLIDGATPFPGWAAAFPVLGSSFVVLASVAGGGIGNRALTPRPVVFVGEISYSLYLWHWPPLALFHYSLFRTPDAYEAALIIAFAFACSVLSWRYIERPFRGSGSQISVWKLGLLVAGTAATFAIAATAIIRWDGLPGRLNSEARAYLQDESFAVPSECFYRSPVDIAVGKACLIGAPGEATTFVVWGDLHASRIANTMTNWGKASGLTGWQAAKGSCPPLVGATWAGDQLGCSAFNIAVQERIAGDGAKVVVLSAIWANYAEGNLLSNLQASNPLRDGESPTQSGFRTRAEQVSENRSAFKRSFLRTVAALRKAGKLVLIVGPVPELEWSAPHRLASAAQFGRLPPNGPPLESFLERQRHVLEVLKELGQLEGVAVVYPHEVLCGDRVCDIVRNGKRLYFDDNHIDMEANRLLEPMIAAGFERLGVRSVNGGDRGRGAVQ